MTAEKTINIDLNDPRAKEIAEVLGNESCRSILNLIAEKELTESDIAKELGIALNTVDYNIKKLIKTGLIESTNHFWSIRGKRMPSYRVSEKKIIISPKRFSSNILLVPALAIGTALVFVIRKLGSIPAQEENYLYAAKGLDQVMATPATTLTQSIPSNSILDIMQGIANWEWLLIGIWFGVISFFILTKFTQGGRRKK